MQQQKIPHSDEFTREAAGLTKRRETSVSLAAWDAGIRAKRLQCLQRELDASDRARSGLFGRDDTSHGEHAS